MKSKIKIIGNILVIISIIFILNAVINIEMDWDKIFNIHSSKMFFGGLFFQTVIVFFSCVPWILLVKSMCGTKIKCGYVWYTFLKSNLYKYLPGNFLHYIGRNQLAIDYDISHVDLILATVMDIFMGLGMGICFSLLFFKERLWNSVNNLFTVYFFIIICLIIIIVIYVSKKVKYIRDIVNKYVIKIKKIETIKAIGSGCVFYFIQNILTILNVSFVCKICIPEINIWEQVIIGASYIFSSVIGTITPGAPAGIGIREMVMININSRYTLEEILMLSIIMRVISIVGDFLAYMCYEGGRQIKMRKI